MVNTIKVNKLTVYLVLVHITAILGKKDFSMNLDKASFFVLLNGNGPKNETCTGNNGVGNGYGNCNGNGNGNGNGGGPPAWAGKWKDKDEDGEEKIKKGGKIAFSYGVSSEVIDMPVKTKILDPAPSGSGGVCGNQETDQRFAGSFSNKTHSSSETSSIHVGVEVHTDNVTESEAMYSYDDTQHKSSINFCVRTDFGTFYYLNETAVALANTTQRMLQEDSQFWVETSITYNTISFVMYTNMSDGFNEMSFEAKEIYNELNEGANISEDLSVCECDVQSKQCITSPKVYDQNTIVSLCVQSLQSAIVTDIRSVTMELVGASVQVEAVSPVNGPNAITVVGGLGTEVATVSTRIISGFFDDTATYNNVLVTGFATVGFSENRRTLVRTSSKITKDIETQHRELEDEESEALGLFSLSLNLGENQLAPDSSSMSTTLANVFMSIVALGITCILN